MDSTKHRAPIATASPLSAAAGPAVGVLSPSQRAPRQRGGASAPSGRRVDAAGSRYPIPASRTATASVALASAAAAATATATAATTTATTATATATPAAAGDWESVPARRAIPLAIASAAALKPKSLPAAAQAWSQGAKQTVAAVTSKKTRPSPSATYVGPALPADLVALILGLCRGRDAVSAARTCRWWHWCFLFRMEAIDMQRPAHLATLKRLTWLPRLRSVSLGGGLSTEQLALACNHLAASSLTSLTLRDAEMCPVSESWASSAEVNVPATFSRLTKLHQLSLEGTVSASVAHTRAIGALTQLRSLAITSPAVRLASGRELAQLTNLESLVYRSNRFHLELTPMSRLQTLDLSGALFDVSRSDPLGLAALVPSLTTLVIREAQPQFCGSISELFAALAHLSSLTTLDMASVSISPSSVSTADLALLPSSLQSLDMSNLPLLPGAVLPSHLRSLRRLLVANTQLSDGALNPLLLHSSQLERLDLAGNSSVSNACMHRVGRLAALHWLSLSGTQVTDHGLGMLAGCTALTELNVSHCPMSNRAFARLDQLTRLTMLHNNGMANMSELAFASLPCAQLRVSTIKFLQNEIYSGDFTRLAGELSQCRRPLELQRIFRTTNLEGHSILSSVAVCNGAHAVSIMESLVRWGADVNQPGAGGRRPVTAAAESGVSASNMLACLLRLGASVGAPTLYDLGFTAGPRAHDRSRSAEIVRRNFVESVRRAGRTDVLRLLAECAPHCAELLAAPVKVATETAARPATERPRDAARSARAVVVVGGTVRGSPARSAGSARGGRRQ